MGHVPAGGEIVKDSFANYHAMAAYRSPMTMSIAAGLNETAVLQQDLDDEVAMAARHANSLSKVTKEFAGTEQPGERAQT